MPTKVPIEIFFIQKTTADRDEMKRWLEFKGVKDYTFPPPETVTDSALTIGVSAKRCYLSFDTTQNPNLSKVRSDWGEYIDNILKTGHGCYDSETDVLTSAGWKPWPEVTRQDYLATLNKSGGLVYCRPDAVTAVDYTGRMYRVETRGVDLLVTPNHQMYVCPTTTRNGRKREDFKLIRADSLDAGSHAYLKSAQTWDSTCEVGYPADVLRLLGFSIGDGSYESGLTVRFRLRRPRKVTWLYRVVDQLNQLQPGEWEIRYDGTDRYSLGFPASYRHLFSEIYADGEKCIPSGVLIQSSRDGLAGLLEGLMQSDGHEGVADDSFHTTSEVLSGQIMQLCLHVGIAANVRKVYGPEDRPTSYGTKPLIQMSILSSRSLKPEVNKYAGSEGRTSWVEDWSGEVFCAQMPEDTQHVLYVRRNGYPVWCGNSVLEHAVYSFAIENVSRIFTGEMNRHRAGWAISEGSMRFIRFGENIPYWEPTYIQGSAREDDVARNYLHWSPYVILECIRNGHETATPLDVEHKKELTRIVMQRAFGAQQEWYKVLEAVWADELKPESSFKQKKELTSLFRRIVGMGCATGGVWTGNIRAIRHVMTMRCEPAAEEEILHVFSRIVVEMKKREPMLIGDFEQDAAGFWRPKYKKV